MANIKSAKKRAKTNEIKRQRNIARRSDIKTSAKKVLTALDQGNVEEAKTFLKAAEAKISRAQGKGLLKKNTASRKVSNLAKKVAAASRQQ
jgi:small subunit ribosomal protein S20